ncbi:hypothetical protein [Alienimonas californiensis]|uniref:Uncharacterized protein n=1 Tax=Alienimonas californiensis TaxID=2527989 RepID=A0A517PB08_9PLAN|nr:hypothetical protein [Alienimonas californiensis]QDT16559.1 hypothetical protein CA12_26650 [Alienimonas californiensis]
MTPLDILTGAAEAVLWYPFLWFGLDSIEKRNPWFAAAVLLALGYAAFVACPWVRDTDAWKNLAQ